MPIQRGYSSGKGYFKWGTKGKKYYYKIGSKISREKAYEKAHKQMIAIFANKWYEK